MRTCRRSIFPAVIRLILLLAGICYFAPEGAAGQANILQCPRQVLKAGSPCQSSSPLTLRGNEAPLNLGVGNPVHLASGNKYLEMTDLPPQGNALPFIRTYNAMDPADSGMGAGWRHSYEISLRRTPGGLQIIQADGSLITFGQRKGNLVPALAPSHGRLERVADEWHWRWPDGNTLSFSQQGLLTNLAIDGHRLHVQRYSRASIFADQIHQVRSERGHVLIFHYQQLPDARFRLTGIDTPQGTIRYYYDSPAGRLVAVQAADGTRSALLYEPANQGGGNIWQLTGLAVAAQGADPGKALPMHSLANVDPELYRLRTWQYDSAGRVIRAVLHDQPAGIGTQYFRYHNDGADGRPGITEVMDGDGQLTRFVWRRQHGRYLLVSVRGHGCLACPAPGLSATYDDAGRLSAINGLHLSRHPNGTPSSLYASYGLWPRLALHYDQNGLLTSWHSALTGTQIIGYDRAARPTVQHFSNGTQWQYDYDSLGRLRTVRESAGRRTAPITTVIDYAPDGTVTLKHPNEIRSHRRDTATGTLRIDIMRPTSSANPYPVRYQDVLLGNATGTRILQLLPEGGSLRYTYSPDQKLISITWEDVLQRHHPVLLQTEPGKAIFGNQVHIQYRQDQSDREQKHVMFLSDINKRLILGLNRLAAPNGRVLQEDYYFPTQALALRRRYLHAQHQQMVGVVEQRYHYPGAQLSRTPVAAGKRHLWYAWDKTGASLGRYNGRQTQRPRILRNASGLPTQVGQMHTRYGLNHRLQAVYYQGRRVQQNLHNALGQRIIRQDNQGFTQFYYQDNRVAGEWIRPSGAPLAAPVNGAISRRYIYAGAIPVAFIDYAQPAPFFDRTRPDFTSVIPPAESPAFQSVLRRRLNRHLTGTLYFIHTDTQGLPLAITDSQARPVWLVQPEPEGKLTPLIARQHLSLRYPGQYEDASTGWFDNIYRTYDPAFGHYLEPDPAGPLPGNDPLGYAAGQPRRYSDPLGLLLFAFDGTLNQGAETNSNVFRLQQRYNGSVHYIGGPGTMHALSALAEPAVHGAASPLQSSYVLGPLGVLLRPADAVTGDSIGDIVRTQMHHFIDSLVQDAPGLKLNNGHIPIDIIGFSRGATAARIFANQLMKQTNQGLFHAQVYQHDPVTGRSMGKAVALNACLDFRFMGLFDTVAQLGILGSGNAAYDYQVSPAWGWVAHAVALNEYNDMFPLTPIGASHRGNFHEIGLMGNHSDIGGSIQAPDTKHVANASGLPGDLGNVALQWMHQQALRAGAPFKPLPPDALHIRNPLVHNSLIRYRHQDPADAILRRDRQVQFHSGNLGPQHQLASLGRSQRMQIEPLIKRDLPQKRPLTMENLLYGTMMAVPPGEEKALISQPIVGVADIRAYAQWLRETTGLKLQTGEVW